MNFIKDVLVMAFPRLVQVLYVILTLSLLAQRNIITINLTVLISVYLYDLSARKPSGKRWLIMTIKTVSVTSLILFLWQLAGAWGFLAIFFLTLVFAAWRLYEGWDLFQAVTSWGADRLKGSKEEFDISKVKVSVDERRTEETSNGQPDEQAHKHNQGVGEEPSSVVESEEDRSSNHEELSEVHEAHSEQRTRRRRGRTKVPVPKMPEDMGGDNE